MQRDSSFACLALLMLWHKDISIFFYKTQAGELDDQVLKMKKEVSQFISKFVIFVLAAFDHHPWMHNGLWLG